MRVFDFRRMKSRIDITINLAYNYDIRAAAHKVGLAP